MGFQYNPPNLVSPEFSSYVTGARTVTMEDMQRYVNDPLYRERLKFMNSVSGVKELDMRIASVIEENKRNATLNTGNTSAKIKIPIYIPVNKHNTDISFLHGVQLPNIEMEDNESDIGSPVKEINLNNKSEELPEDNNIDTGVLSINIKPANYQLPIEEISTEVEPLPPIPAGFNMNGIIVPYDHTGVNRSITILQQEETNDSFSLFGDSTSGSLISGTTATAVNMSPGYNSSTNYMGYGTSPYANDSLYGNYGIYGIYANGMNPYEMQRRREAEEARVKAQEQIEKDVAKRLYKAVCNYNGLPIENEVLAEIDGDYSYILDQLSEEERQKYEMIRKKEEQYRANHERILRLETQPYYINQRAIAWSNVYCGYIENERKKIPNNVGLVEWLEKYAPAKLCEAYEMREEREARKNIRSLCDDNEYSRALEQRRMELHIDDQNVHLPSNSGINTYGMNEDYKMKRRKAFIAEIIKNRVID